MLAVLSSVVIAEVVDIWVEDISIVTEVGEKSGDDLDVLLVELSDVVTSDMVDGSEEKDGFEDFSDDIEDGNRVEETADGSVKGNGVEDIWDDGEVAVNVDDLLVELWCVVPEEVVDIWPKMNVWTRIYKLILKISSQN